MNSLDPPYLRSLLKFGTQWTSSFVLEIQGVFKILLLFKSCRSLFLKLPIITALYFTLKPEVISVRKLN